MSEFTVSSLKEYMEKRLSAIETFSDKRFTAQEEAVRTAFDAAKEAITKSEVAVEKRADAVYVTIGKLQDLLITVVPRAEAEQRYNALSEKMTELTDRVNRNDGKSTGMSQAWGILLSVVGLISIIISIVISLR